MLYLTSRMRFSDLSEQQVLALAISSEEDDARIYRGFAARLHEDYPGTAAIFSEMANEEDQHRISLIELHQKRFGDTIPLIRREHVSGFYARKPTWLSAHLTLDQIRHISENMETASRTFYENAEKRSTDADTRRLLGDLAAVEASHQDKARFLTQSHMETEAESEDETAHRKLVLTLIQPGLAGLMDGSVSTLAPCSPPPLQRATHGPHFWSALPPQSGQGFPWALRKQSLMTGRSLGAAPHTARVGLRGDDGHWRAGAHHPLSHQRVLDSHVHRVLCRGCRALCHRVDTEQIHGNAALAGDVSGCPWRLTGVCRRRAHRRGLAALLYRDAPPSSNTCRNSRLTETGNISPSRTVMEWSTRMVSGSEEKLVCR